MRRLLFFLFLLNSSLISAQKTVEPNVLSRVIDAKYQFISQQTGLPVNQDLWDEVEPFVNGFARVLRNDKFSFVNGNGKLISPVIFEGARNFVNSLAAVKKDGKWGFINESGKIIFDFNYDIVFDFSEPISVALENKTWKLISSNGNVIMPLDISVCYGFKNGTAKILKDGREGILNTKGEINLTSAETSIKNPIPYNPNQNVITSNCPDNIDFEYGNFTNWQCYIGRVDSVGTTNVITVNPSPPTANRHTIVPRVVPSALDPFGLFPTNPPDGSNFAVRLGNTNIGAQAERIRYTIHVPLNDSNFSIVYDYAVVFQDPGHTPWTQPRFISRLLDSATNTYIDCASFEYISTSSLPGFARSTVDTSVIFKPWASVFYSLRGHGGQTLYLEFTTADCVRRGHWGYAYVDVESTCGDLPEVHYDCTYPNITTLIGPPGFQFYNWWDSTFTTLLGTGRTLILNPGPALNTVIWLEVVPFSNFGCLDTLKVTITGILNAHFDVSDTSTCGAPKTITFYNRNLPSLTTFWDFGDGNTATGDTVTHTFLSPGSYRVQLNVSVPGGCNGTATYDVVIKPIPNVVQPINQSLCNGATTNAITFTGSVSGTAFNWTNSNPSIGLAASGIGNIPAFTSINTGTAPVIATITVTPSANGCTGPPQIFTITVNPTPNVVQPSNQILCNGASTAAIAYTGSVSGSTFSWTNNNTSIGLAASGNGNIPAFTAINNSNTPVTATITVIPSASGCPGAPKTFTITVNPTPNVVQPVNQILCNGAITNTVAFTGSVTGSIFSWTNNNTSIGLAASGNGNIPAFTAVNNSNSPVTATITVTPSASGCPGTSKTFTIIVNPTPNVAQPANQILCNGAITNTVAFTGSVGGATYSWTNSNPSIGLAASGNGNIPAFTAVNTSNIPITATITVTPSAAGCPGLPKSFTITVNPTPNVVQPANQTLCNGATTNTVAFAGSVTGSTFNWTNNNTTIGLAANGNGNIPAFTAVNTGFIPVTATITVTPSASGCPGTPQTFTITVNPTPNVVQPANQTLCNGATTNAIAFTGSVAASTFNWSNNNTSIGLAASGNGNIPAFTAINTGTTPVTATITVTPLANSCPGTPQTFTITVNPTPNVVQPANQIMCNGASTSTIAFTGSVTGSTFSWTNNNTSIGLAASGIGNIPGFTVVNTGITPVTATITVTISANGCPGTSKTFTITVNPTPNVVQPPNESICNGASTSAIAFTGSVTGSTFNWTNNNTSIGLAASGNGNSIPSFTGNNTGNTPVTATITVTPSAAGCQGTAQSFNITVHPTPLVSAGNDKNVCLGNSIQLSAAGASNYFWSPADRLSCTNCPNPVSTPIDDIRYNVRGVSSFGCEANDSILITVSKPFQMLISPNDTLCIGDSTNLTASGANNYLWSPPQGLNRTDIPNPTARPITTTLYRAVGYDGKNCFTDTNYVKITVGPKPTVDIGPDLNLSTGSIVNFNPVTQYGPIINWAWAPPTGLSCTSCPAPSLTVTDNIYYTLTVTNNYGCKASDIISIFVFCKSAQVFIPNAFTPDGDGLNDILMVRGKGIFVKNFRIFNRWGELVFERKDFNPNDIKYGWDGKVRGVPATPDVFVYTAEVICDNGVLYTYKGNTTLLK